MRINPFAVFGVLGQIGDWATEALKPDQDGKVRLTVDELAKLAQILCGVFGWKAEIVTD